MKTYIRTLALLILTTSAVSALPKLRLSTATVGPVVIAVGQNGSAQSVDFSNFGDGSLALTATANVPWLTPSIGASKVQIGLSTAPLARGKYAGVVTVADPNAVDAPQTIVVTVQIGSGVPDSVDLYLPPGGSTSTSFATGSPVGATVSNPASGPVLSIAATGGGSFAFSYSYQIAARASAGTPENDYRGSITTTGSTFQGDNKNVPVNIHVTSQPIAALSPASVQFRIALGAAKADKWVQFSNTGTGVLTISNVIPSATWLTGKIQSNIVVLTADPAGMTPGTYTATANITANSRNGPFSVPVQLDVLAAGPPVSFFQGVLDNALFKVGDPVTPGGIVAISGEQFTTGPAVQAQSLPLGNTLGGASVFVNNQPAPVYYVAASHVVNPGGQINFQMPYSVAPGEATVRVDRDGKRGNSVSVQVAAVAPRLLRLGIADYGIAVLGDNATFPIPPTAGIPSRPAKAGIDALTFYALGLGQTDPPVVEGKPAPGAEPFARVPGVKIVFGEGNVPGTGVTVDPFFVGLTPSFVGLYQINSIVPDRTPRGDTITVYISVNGVLSNRVNIAVQ